MTLNIFKPLSETCEFLIKYFHVYYLDRLNKTLFYYLNQLCANINVGEKWSRANQFVWENGSCQFYISSWWQTFNNNEWWSYYDLEHIQTSLWNRWVFNKIFSCQLSIRPFEYNFVLLFESGMCQHYCGGKVVTRKPICMGKWILSILDFVLVTDIQ